MKPPFIGKRLVFHFSGYDPTPPDRAYRRFVRELRRFEETWSVTASASKAQVGSDEAWWDIVTAGPNWRVETRYVFVRWDDVIEANRSQPMWRRVPHALLVFLDFVAAGAFWRYLRTNWRYALFFLYPYVLFGTFLVIGSYVGLFCTELSGSRIVGAIAALMVVTALLQWPGRRLYLPFLFDDWIFSANYIRRSNRIL